jgi:hypothetical protein
MEFPPQWNAFPLEDFDTAAARTQGCRRHGAHGADEAQRQTAGSRQGGHRRVQILEVEVPLGKLIPSPNLNGLKARYQFWARDTAIRRNMTTSVWKDVYALIHSHEIQVEEETGGPVISEDVIRELDSLPTAVGKTAVVRHAIVIGEDQRMQLELQSLPTSLAHVSGKPFFRG